MNQSETFGALPGNVEKYRETQVYDVESIPKGFTRKHSTKKGVWGRIVVVSGDLELTIFEPRRLQLMLSEGEFAVTAPKQAHRVKLNEGASFKIEFYHVPNV